MTINTMPAQWDKSTPLYTLVSGMATVLAITAWSSWSGEHSFIRILPGAAALTFLLYATGRGFLFRAGELLFGSDGNRYLNAGDFILCLCFGVFAQGIALMFFSYFLGIQAAAVFLCTALGALALPVWAAKRSAARAEASTSMVSLAAVILALAAATLWSVDAFSPIQQSAAGPVFVPWNDLFIHATVITNFSTPEYRTPIHSVEGSGLPMPFYHYASFCLAAVFSELTDLSSLTVACSFAIPFGIFLLTVTAYLLITAFFTPAAGLLAAMLSICLPDASRYGLHNRWFSYYWMQHNGVSMCYGMAAAVLVLLIFLKGMQRQRYWSAALALILVPAVLFFKAQVFVPFAALMGLLTVIYLLPMIRGWGIKRITALIVFGAAAAAVLGVVLQQASIAPTVLHASSGFSEYVVFVAEQLTEFQSAPALRSYLAGLGPVMHWAAGTMLILVCSFGLLLPAYLAALLVLCARRGLHALDWIPLLSLLVYCLIIWLLPKNQHFDPWVMQHRGFLWTYLLLAAGLGACISRLLAFSTTAAAITFAAALIVPARLGPGVHAAAPPWGAGFINTPLAPALLDAAHYIRKQTATGDIIQTSEALPTIIAAGLSDRFTYLSRPEVWQARPAVQPEIARRLALLDSIRNAASVEQLRPLVAQVPIRWYLVYPDSPPAWADGAEIQPAFEKAGYKLIDFQSLR